MAAVTGSEETAEPDDIFQLLDQPDPDGSQHQSPESKGRRIPTSALIVLCVMIAIGLLTFAVWPHQSGGPQPWKKREITLPAGAGKAFYRDRVVDSFFGTVERRIDIKGRYDTGTVRLPESEKSGSRRGAFVWHEADPQFGAMGPWLEIKDRTANYLIDMREIGLYRLRQVNGQLCAVLLSDRNDVGEVASCDTALENGRSAMNISALAETWSSVPLALLDRRPRRASRESAAPPRRKARGSRRKPRGLVNVAEAGISGCDSPPRPEHSLRGPPRMEYIGVSGRSRNGRCPPPPPQPAGPSN